jgi:predicted alpha/beta hydrolase
MLSVCRGFMVPPYAKITNGGAVLPLPDTSSWRAAYSQVSVPMSRYHHEDDDDAAEMSVKRLASGLKARA